MMIHLLNVMDDNTIQETVKNEKAKILGYAAKVLKQVIE